MAPLSRSVYAQTATLTSTAHRIARRNTQHTSRRHASILFALQGLSNSRETQHFNKISRLNRVEHSPNLQLIKSSEVQPFVQTSPTALVVKKPPLELIVSAAERTIRERRSRPNAIDTKALQVGRAILSENTRLLRRASRTLTNVKDRARKQEFLASQEREMWRMERAKMAGELRSAGAVIILAVGAATALATWRFWPAADKSLLRIEDRQVLQEAGRIVDSVRSVEGSALAAEALTLPVAEVSSPVAAEQKSESTMRRLRRLFWKLD